MTYADTSVLGPVYWPEERSQSAREALAQTGPVAISWLVEVEFAAALAGRVRNREISAAQARQSFDLFRTHRSTGRFAAWGVEPDDAQRAWTWLASMTLRLRTFDALHLAIAAGHHADLLTADAVLAQGAKQVGVPVRLLK